MDVPSASSLHIKLSLSPARHCSTPASIINTRSMATTRSSSKPKKTIYFGYGSNLWLHQMRQRCPTSAYLGIARLKGYKWIISERGYANVVELGSSEEKSQPHDSRFESDDDDDDKKHDYSKEVWGLVYSLEPADEARLDVNEGVAHGSYAKEWIECEFWTASSERDVSVDTLHDFSYAAIGRPDIKKKRGKEKMLVYINRKTVEDGEIRDEYVYRMNCGIRDAVKEGLPVEYVEQVLRKYIPEEERDHGGVVELARRQAKGFGDENED